MSKYTTQLRYICEQKAGLYESSTDYSTVINNSYDKIIHPETPLYDPSYAPVLYKKIIRHYYFDEIAHETVGQFIMRLNLKLDEILPYYNKLYQSAALSFNPLYDVDYTVTGNREDNNTVNRTRTDNLNELRTDNLTAQRTDNLTDTRTDNLQSQRTDNLQSQRTDNLETAHNLSRDTERTDNLANSGTSSTTELFSDTPEGSLSGVNNATYLTNARKTDSTASGTNTGTQDTIETVTELTEDSGTQTTANTGTQTTANTGTQTNKKTGTETTANTGTQNTANTGTQKNDDIIHNENEYFEHVTGKRGGTDYADLIRKFRDTFINIDMMIINELHTLFMEVY